MSAATLQGVVVTVLDSPTFRGTHARSPAQRLHNGYVARSTSHRDLHDYQGVAGPFVENERREWFLFLEGVGETWRNIDGSSIGSCGSVPNSGGTYTVESTGGKFSGRFAVGSGSYVELPSTITPADGWSVRVWRKESGGSWEHYVVFGTGTNVAAAAVSASVDGAASVQASTLGVENWLGVASDGDVQLMGVDDTGTNSAVDYSEAEIRPFEVLDEMATGMAAVTVEGYALPKYKMSGDAIGKSVAGNDARYIKVDVMVTEETVPPLGSDLQGMLAFTAMQSR